MCAGNNNKRELSEARDRCPTREEEAAAAGDGAGKGGGGGSDVSPTMGAPTHEVRSPEQECEGMLALRQGWFTTCS